MCAATIPDSGALRHGHHRLDPIVILSIARTPMGAMQGALADASATDLGATAVKAAVERAGVSGEDIDRIYMGCVLPAGPRPGAGAPGGDQGGPAQVGPGDDRQQGLRLAACRR